MSRLATGKYFLRVVSDGVVVIRETMTNAADEIMQMVTAGSISRNKYD